MTIRDSVPKPAHNRDVYCYLKRCLEPRYSVVAEPQVGYFAQWKFCYRVFDADQLLAELQGDFRELSEGSLAQQSLEVVQSIGLASVAQQRSRQPSIPPDIPLPIASRLPPKRPSRAWFSSGRAAYSWLLRDVVKPRRIFLPTFICWSLVDVMLERFPDVQLELYPVDKRLQCAYPSGLDTDDAVVAVHYFGQRSCLSDAATAATILEDCSHCHPDALISTTASHRTIRFGSLRKVFRVADGGFVDTESLPQYETDSHDDAWLRLNARDWRDLREAENMVDREFRISDICSQSLATILTASSEAAKRQRQFNDLFLVNNFPCGKPLVSFRADESPLLHNRCFESPAERNSLRDFLLTNSVFTSIHWPVHSHLLKRRDSVCIDDAVWLQDHTFAIPVAEDFGEREMELVCNAARKWQAAGSSRFSHLAAG